MTAPVRYEPAREVRKSAAPAASSGRPMRRSGTVDATIRVFLHNEKYAGIWRFKEREWVHVPGEDRRMPRKRPASEVMVQERPHLRIIDEDTWTAVQARREQPAQTHRREQRKLNARRAEDEDAQEHPDYDLSPHHRSDRLPAHTLTPSARMRGRARPS